jgi:hypothetical protein
MEAGHHRPARSPDSGQIRACASRSSSTSGAGVTFTIALVITRLKMGPAPVMPDTCTIGAPSKLPAQIATVRSRV